jgi:isopentenyl phosphate kinase
MIIFLKLGGSLITEKEKAFTARVERIRQIAEEVQIALKEKPDLQVLIGHGSGSFGHYAAKDAGTRDGVYTSAQWKSFQQVWYAARLLNNIVIDEFNRIGLPVISLQPSAAITAEKHAICEWNTQPIIQSLKNGLIPIVYGDVIFDRELGGVILSTEDLFFHLIDQLNPVLILIAGKEKGVYADYPLNKKLIPSITLANWDSFSESIKPSEAVDVTGGMQEKVNLMRAVVEKKPDVQIQIFSGEENGNIKRSLCGERIGTRIAVS